MTNKLPAETVASNPERERICREIEEYLAHRTITRGAIAAALAKVRSVRDAATPSPAPEQPDRISLEVFQHDWIPGFAAFHDDGSLDETAKAHVVLNLGSLLAVVIAKDLPAQELPYVIAESLMHEAIHALEAWAKVEFSEERIEALTEQYRRKYGPDANSAGVSPTSGDTENRAEGYNRPQERGIAADPKNWCGVLLASAFGSEVECNLAKGHAGSHGHSEIGAPSPAVSQPPQEEK